MSNMLLTGALAGAAGTIVLDGATSADMALRGRPASSAPATLVQKLAERAGWRGLADPQADETVQNRRSGLGSLAGYGVGLGVGIAAAAVRRLGGDRVPFGATALLAAGAALAASDIPLARLGVSDPASWSAADWASDIIPHLLYGITVAAVVEAVSG